MRGRLALLAGLGAGYVLGARAGRERYEEIRDGFNRLMGTEQAQQLQTQVRDVASKAGDVVEQKAADGISKAGESLGKAGEKAQDLVSSVKSGGSSDTPESVTLP